MLSIRERARVGCLQGRLRNGVRKSSASVQKLDGRGAPHWAAGTSKRCEAAFRELKRGTPSRTKWSRNLCQNCFGRLPECPLYGRSRPAAALMVLRSLRLAKETWRVL